MATCELELVPATAALAHAIAPKMRASDVEEVRAAAGLAPLDALLRSLEISLYARAALFEGTPGAMWGVAPGPLEHLGIAWLLGTDAIREHKEAFLSACRAEVARMLQVRPCLTNMVDARNEVSLRWLTRLGASWGEPRPFGPEGLTFVPFYLWEVRDV